MKRIAFIIFCTVTIGSLEAQIFKAFSGDLTAFPEEVKQLFISDPVANKTQLRHVEQTIEEFLLSFDRLDPDKQLAFVDMCNIALKANMRPFPTFENVLKSTLNFLDTGQFAQNYDAYIGCLKTIAEKRKMRDFEALLNNISRLSQTGFLYESLSAKWKTDSESSFEFFDGKPRFVFPKTNLTCYANNDSAKIHATQGIFYPLSSSWHGTSGLVDFTRAGYDLSEMFIQLNTYEINLKTSRYQADSVSFFNKIYFKKSLFGRMEEKILPNVKTGQASYPVFMSYSKSLKIDDIFENVDFEGQYTQVGSRVKCGEKDEMAMLSFRQNNKVVFTVSAKSFVFGKQRISAPLAEVRIALDNGEVLHPTCEVRYDDKLRELSVLHPSMNAFKTPIYNSYHELDMYVDAIYWNIDSSLVDFRMLKIPNLEGIGIFESKQFYSTQDLQELMQQIDYNPLFLLRQMSNKYNSGTLEIKAIANFFGQDVTQMKVLLLRMASKGFLRYDAENETVELHEKLFHHLQSSAKRSDYDIIQIISNRINESNATLNLHTQDLQIFGVEKIFLSTQQNVYVIPNDQTITVKKNRDFAFAGKIHSGKFDFIASNCYFDYDRFKISMDTIETMEFAVKHGEPDLYGQYLLKEIETTIEQLAGEIFIDSTTNKSGKEYYPEYPIFASFKDSYVSYEKEQTQNGVYKFDKFFYTIYPFRLQNLNNFATDSLRFDGYLTSAGIFPDIHEKLKVMPDFSLGFTVLSPDSAWPVYQGKAKFYDTLHLSNDGLIGSGKLEFLTSTNLSNRFIFMPDSLNAWVKAFDVAAQSIGVEFPQTQAKISKLHWEPYRNVFSSTNKTEGFSMFDNDLVFYGELLISDTGMLADGRVVFKNQSELNSTKFIVKNRELTSDNVEFAIKSDDGKSTAIQSENYNVRVNLDDQKGYFKSNDSSIFLGFPINRYLCHMNELEWDMKSNHVYLKNSQKSSYTDEQLDQMSMRELIAIGDDLPGSDFVSLHPKQDSLTFNSPIAEYNLETNELDIQQVRIIYTADIAVQPAQGNIVIGKDASMKPFENADLLVDVEHQYFDIHDANITIQGRSKYTASGTYDYTDIIGKKIPIRFEKLTPNRNGISSGTAKITPDDASFALNPAFDFIGQIMLTATDSLLNFAGNSTINHLCDDNENRSWFNFEAPIDPKYVKIPISEELKERGGRRVGTGFYMNAQGDLFPAFFTPVKSTDKITMRQTGIVFYDSVQKSYIVESQDDTAQNDRLVYNIKDCSLKAYGTTDLHLGLGRVGWDMFGTLFHTYHDHSTLFDGVIGLKFFFDENALNMFYAALEKAEGNGAEQNTGKFIDYLQANLSQREAERLLKEINLYGSYRRLPSDLEKTILFSDVKMQWDEASRSFVSLGKLGIASIGQTHVNKYLDGVLQIVKSRRGDVINLYLETGRREWYFFSYSDGLMQVISSDPDFNDAITMLKPSKRKQKKGGEGRGSYEFGLSTMRKKTDFLFKVNAIKNELNDSGQNEEEIDGENEEFDAGERSSQQGEDNDDGFNEDNN